jgi:16S rRNA (cytosine967-C5)-methyltransferase
VTLPPPPRRTRAEGVARDIALDVLSAVTADDAYANLALGRTLAQARADRRDAALATELVFGTLRLRGRYDAVIAHCSARPLDRIDPVVLDALRLGCHQLLTLATADYAAVSATVDQVRRRRGHGAAKFANAVLRAVSQRPWDEWLDLVAPPPHPDPVARWAVEYSQPEWIIRAFGQSLERQSAGVELPDLLRVNDDPGPVTLVARPGRSTVADLLAETGGTAGAWSPWAVRVSGDPGQFPSVRSHRAGVQDEGSQLMALAVSRLSTPAGAWLDLCAGPGGKTADLAGLAAEVGAGLVAVEQHPHRADLVRQATADGPPVDVVTGDALTVPLGSFARILLDAPCTGLGALRRRPELRWRRKPGDLPQLRAIQRRLLSRAVDLLVPGGMVVYVTCSPHIAETHDIVRGVLRNRSDLRLVPAAPLLPEVPDAASGDTVQLWPQRHNTDGMFLAVVQRTP